MSTPENTIQTLDELYKILGFNEPKNTYIDIIRGTELQTLEKFIGEYFVLNMFSVTLKDKNSGIHFGRKNYDFDEGAMIFSSPKQSLFLTKTEKLNEMEGWMLIFHPDLIKNTFLEKKIEDYKFFSYDIDEALHLSFDEQVIVSNCVELIENEIENSKDNFSKDVIISILDLLLNFCSRFYERQFNTRIVQNNFITQKVKEVLKRYYEDELHLEQGVPNAEYLTKELEISLKYLNDTLKKETGQTTKDYINSFIVDRSKKMLLTENYGVAEVAYDLGFNYPHYFGRLFKTKTGVTPLEYKKKH